VAHSVEIPYLDKKNIEMKKGILVYDKSDAEYNKWFIEHLITEGAKQGLDIRLILTEEIRGIDADFAIIRNRDCVLGEELEGRGIRCFNSSYVCKIGNDKWEMYRDFSVAGIPVMYTQLSKLPYPFVMKPRDGHGGQNVMLIKNAEEYEEALEKISVRSRNSICQNNTDKYIYQFVASETGRDIRVYVVGDTILTAMERKAGSEEFRANFSLGGTATEHALTEEELKLAAKVAEHIKADFVGIDIIYNNGKPIVNEVEDAVGTRMLYANTDIDAVKEYINWIVKCLSL